MTELLPNQILLTFDDAETVEYIKLVCRRARIDLEGYILDNFEWDGDLPCIENGEVTTECCEGCVRVFCECPDAKLE